MQPDHRASGSRPAIDLRMILTVTKIVNDLERDRRRDEEGRVQGGAGARQTHRLTQRALLRRRARARRARRRDAAARARRVRAARRQRRRARSIDLDDEIDAAFSAIMRQLISYMMEDPRTITPALEIVFIAKSIERIGDHAKNIAGSRRAGGQWAGRAPRVGRADPRRGGARRPMMPTILVVEDEPAILELLKVNLRRRGLRGAGGGRRRDGAGAAHASRCRTCCCSTGCCPGNRASRSRSSCAPTRARKELPVIMVTARTDEADTRRRPRGVGRRLRDQAVLAARAQGADQVGAAPARAGGGAGAACRRARSSSIPSTHRVTVGGATGARWARPNSGCCASSWRAPSASTRARNCSTRCGAITCTSRSAPSTSTSAGCASRSSRSSQDELIETVRGSGLPAGGAALTPERTPMPQVH